MRAQKAIILAAGAGRRLGAFTDAHPKPLLEIHGTSILGNCLTRLKQAGISDVVLVVGHFKEQIIDFCAQHGAGLRIRFVEAHDYATTNNIYSLWLARQELNEDILLLEADIFFDHQVLEALQTAPGDNVAAVARFSRGMDGAVMRGNSDGQAQALIEGREQGPGFDYEGAFKTVNIYRFGATYLREAFVPALEAAIQTGRVQDYYELLLKDMLHEGRHRLDMLDCSAMQWQEIDDPLDRAAAEYIFATPAQRKKFLSKEYGSYWRYGVVDHAYIYNPYFPSADLWKRLKNDFELVAREYPAGQASLARAAGLAFDVNPQQIVIANGASELIRILCQDARVAVAVPSFNEYENACAPDKLIRIALQAPDYKFDAAAFAAQAKAGRAEFAVVVSPNNPTSLAVSRAELLQLCADLQESGTIVLLDESFTEFSHDPQDVSLQDQLAQIPNLAIIKSLSKVYGIAGLRLGTLQSADQALLTKARAGLPIWNINGFAEQFLRLMPRYRAAFRESCAQVRADTLELHALLEAIPGGRAFAPEANFVFWRLPEGLAADVLVERLFAEHHMLIKDCSEKTMQDGWHFVRIAARTPAENQRLVQAMRAVIGA